MGINVRRAVTGTAGFATLTLLFALTATPANAYPGAMPGFKGFDTATHSDNAGLWLAAGIIAFMIALVKLATMTPRRQLRHATRRR